MGGNGDREWDRRENEEIDREEDGEILGEGTWRDTETAGKK